MQIDLHSHTDASDGRLTPVQLCERAIQRNLQLLAITDHDTVVGAQSAQRWLEENDARLEKNNAQPSLLENHATLRLIPAVEYSSVWNHMGVHVVGLGIDLEHPSTRAACEFFSKSRMQRAEMIGAKLAKLKMPGAFEGALAIAGSSQIGRPHFARYLVEKKYVRTEDEAFDRYLGSGKVGDIKVLWPELAQIVEWIRAAGGVATLAHPSKYRQTGARLRKLAADFAACGGGAIEVVVGRQLPDESRFIAQLCRQNNLAASVGSDFHAPSKWCELGDINALPADCEPVWQRWLS